MTDLTAITVGELAAKLPQAARVFEKYGIDYCCGGRLSVADACASAGVQIDQLVSKIEEGAGPSADTDYSALSQRNLIQHIIVTHHVFTREELGRLHALLQKVISVHESRHPELITIRATFRKLCDDLLPHMMKEEHVLFPYIAAVERASQEGILPGPPSFVTVRNPVRMMTLEHETAGTLLQELRKLTSDYTPPGDGCASYRTLYAAIENLERDLHQHIHLENNILFPRAIRQEAELEAAIAKLASS